MPKIQAPHDYRESEVCIGVHTIALEQGVGELPDDINAGEVAHLRGRGFRLLKPVQLRRITPKHAGA